MLGPGGVGGFAPDAKAQWGTAVLVSTLRELLGERHQSGATQMTSGYKVMCVIKESEQAAAWQEGGGGSIAS